MEKLDNLDKKILSILSKNARIAFKDVAEACDVSRAAVHQRMPVLAYPSPQPRSHLLIPLVHAVFRTTIYRYLHNPFASYIL